MKAEVTAIATSRPVQQIACLDRGCLGKPWQSRGGERRACEGGLAAIRKDDRKMEPMGLEPTTSSLRSHVSAGSRNQGTPNTPGAYGARRAFASRREEARGIAKKCG